MSEYNRQFYTDRVQTPTPGHQPIYMQVPFNWIANLSTQVAPRNLKDPGVASPLLIGVASKSGAIIESYRLASLGSVPGISNPYGGPVGGTDWGFGTLANPIYLHFYTRREPDDEIYYLFSINLSANAAGSQYISGKLGFQILPDPEIAWRLEPGQEVYVALSRPMAAPGLNLIVLGGHYS